MSLSENTANLESILETVNNLPAAGGEADNTAIDGLIQRTLSGSYSNDRVTTIGAYAFYKVPVTSVDFPNVTGIIEGAFYYCKNLETINFPKLKNMGVSSFLNCQKLVTVILRKVDGICTLSSTSIFKNTPIESGTGYVYVPAALVNSYKAATNWTVYANQIRAIEDYPDICGGTT